MGWFDKLRQKPKADHNDDEQTRLVPGVGRMPYPAYHGKEPYVFVSYAHLDSEKVFKEIKRFNEAGFHVWYDEGIAPGNEWTDEIADALASCALFVVMITPTSAPRENVLNEINFALDEKKPFLAIHLEETVMERGLKLRIGTKQAILKYKMTEEEYIYKYTEAFTRLILGQQKKVADAIAAPASSYVDAPSRSDTSNPAVSSITEAPASASHADADKSSSQIQNMCFKPKGVAIISAGEESFTAPANGLYTISQEEVTHGMKFLFGSGSDLPSFEHIASMEMRPCEGDNNELHRTFRVTLTDNSVMERDVQTAWSHLVFITEKGRVKREWYKIDSIRFDHSGTFMAAWPEYALLTMQDNSIVTVPAFTLNAAVMNRPSENTIGYDKIYHWPDTVKTQRGYNINFGEISSVVFGEGSFYKDRLSDVWSYGTNPGWIKEWPVTLSFRDGRTLSTRIAEDYLKFFAIDDFGKVEARADQIRRIDFVDGTNAQNEVTKN